MRKKYTVIKSAVIGGIIALIVGIYLGLSFMYTSGFSYGTWINGEYCTGKSVKEVNEILKAYYSKPIIMISDNEGNTSYIYASDYDFSVDYTDSLTYISNHQNPFFWIENLFKKNDYLQIEPVIKYDEEKIISMVGDLPVYKKYLEMEEPCFKILSGEDGFYLLDTRHDFLDYNKLEASVLSMATYGGALVVSDEFFYEEKPTANEISVKKEWEKLQNFLSTKIVYDMGAEKIPVDSAVLRSFMVLDAQGNFVYDDDNNYLLDDSKIEEFVHELCLRYDTTTLPRKYTTYTGEVIEVDFQLKSTLLDEAKERVYLLDAVHNSVKEVHEPSYIRQGFVKGENDVGDSVIEVNLTTQKLYFIKDGELILETDIVSGNPNKGWRTPKMLCYIYAMSRNVVLRGEGYASPVDYWIPVYQGIGLHDASWQPSFGSDYYLTRGSRGCINLYIDDAKTVYDNAYIGLPVIIY